MNIGDKIKFKIVDEFGNFTFGEGIILKIEEDYKFLVEVVSGKFPENIDSSENMLIYNDRVIND
jgi:hypothetical protein